MILVLLMKTEGDDDPSVRPLLRSIVSHSFDCVEQHSYRLNRRAPVCFPTHPFSNNHRPLLRQRELTMRRRQADGDDVTTVPPTTASRQSSRMVAAVSRARLWRDEARSRLSKIGHDSPLYVNLASEAAARQSDLDRAEKDLERYNSRFTKHATGNATVGGPFGPLISSTTLLVVSVVAVATLLWYRALQRRRSVKL